MLIARDCATHTCDSGPPSSLRRDGGRLWVYLSAPGSCDFDPSWTPCVCASALLKAAGSIDGVGASECCLLGGQGAAVCAALTRSISRPPLAPGRDRSLGAEGGCAGARVG